MCNLVKIRFLQIIHATFADFFDKTLYVILNLR